MKTKITLKNYLSSVNYSISSGGEYLWSCYGDNAFKLDNDKKRGSKFVYSTGVVFDADKQTVYEITLWDYKQHKEYRWTHPRYLNKYREEAAKRRIRPEQSIDDRDFIEVKAETILSKIKELSSK
jgi:predicted molibdopterin-dependent oxidoreductase YjgC